MTLKLVLLVLVLLLVFRLSALNFLNLILFSPMQASLMVYRIPGMRILKASSNLPPTLLQFNGLASQQPVVDVSDKYGQMRILRIDECQIKGCPSSLKRSKKGGNVH